MTKATPGLQLAPELAGSGCILLGRFGFYTGSPAFREQDIIAYVDGCRTQAGHSRDTHRHEVAEVLVSPHIVLQPGAKSAACATASLLHECGFAAS